MISTAGPDPSVVPLDIFRLKSVGEAGEESDLLVSIETARV